MEKIIAIRDKINSFLYINIIKNIAFLFDAEKVHKFFIQVGKHLGNYKISRGLTDITYNYRNKMLRQRILGINFENPVGLSAGFDKNAEITNISGNVGFGFSEVGSITAKYCAGNPGERLRRIKEKESLWVNLGLNNNGVDEISKRLKNKKFDIPIAVSVAKTNCAENIDDEKGILDYIYSLNKLKMDNVGDFYVINISCPNSYGGQPFSRPRAYETLLKEIKKVKLSKPVFVKLSPDLTKKNIDSIIKISSKYNISGFVCTNLTKKHDIGKGGLSGKVIEKSSEDLLKYVYSKTKGKFILISVGGIFSAEDAYRKIKLGANLLELITGMIYKGPNIISEINQGLVRLLKRDGYSNIYLAVGSYHNKYS